MDIFSNILSSIGGGASAFIGGAFTAGIALFLGKVIMPKIEKKIVKYIAKKRKFFIPYVYKMVNDEHIRRIIIEQIFNAQKYLSSESGKKKLKAVKKQVTAILPDILDEYAETIIQIVYDEISTPILSDKQRSEFNLGK